MKVVIVDDAPTNLVLMDGLVRKIPGTRPQTFVSSAEGLDWCLHNEPDLVIVDYMMPAPDGLDFIGRLRRRPGAVDIPILMVTADHERDVRYAALERGATDFLTKPIDRIEFISRVKNMLALRRSHLVLADRASLLADEVRAATEEIHAREHEIIIRLSKAAEYRDPETGAHIVRMARYSGMIALRLGMPRELCEMIERAAPMHDVGKVSTPDHILLKPGRFEPAEWEIMKEHAENGYQILKDSASPLLQTAASIARSHHERYDGSGYPFGLAGENIPIAGRIVAVADVFDALTSRRPYKTAWTFQQAVDRLTSQRGLHFDPACVDAFLAGRDEALAVRAATPDDDDEGDALPSAGGTAIQP